MLTLRKATLADSNLILAWRNDAEAVATSTTQLAVTEAEHDRWYIKVLTDLTVHLYVAETDGGAMEGQRSIGMGRINEERGVAVLSYSIDANYRGLGYGGELVAALTAKAYEFGYVSIQAVCRCSNTASVRALLRQGFEIDPPELLQLRKKIK